MEKREKCSEKWKCGYSIVLNVLNYFEETLLRNVPTERDDHTLFHDPFRSVNTIYKLSILISQV